MIKFLSPAREAFEKADRLEHQRARVAWAVHVHKKYRDSWSRRRLDCEIARLFEMRNQKGG